MPRKPSQSSTEKAALISEVVRQQEESESSPHWEHGEFRRRVFDALGWVPKGAERPSETAIDPSLVNPESLVTLDIIEQKDLDAVSGDPIGRLKLVVAHLPDLIEKLTKVTPLSYHTPNPRNFATEDGIIIVTSRDHSRERLKLTPFSSAYSAMRSKIHTIQTERKDQEEMLRLQGELSVVATEIENRWKDLGHDEKTVLSTKLCDAVKALARKIAKLKRKAYGRLAGRTDFIDILGRCNPTASAAAITAAIRDLKIRAQDAIFIEQHITRDDRDIAAIITENEQRLSFVIQQLAPLAEKNPLLAYKQHETELYLDDANATDDQVARAHRVLKTLIEEKLDKYTVKPFTAYAETISTLLVAAGDKLDSLSKTSAKDKKMSTLKETRTALVQAWVVGKFFEAQRRVERILTDSASDRVINPKKIKPMLAELDAFLKERQVHPHREVVAVQAAFEELIAYIAKLRAYLDRSDCSRAGFEELARSFDFARVVSELYGG